MTTTSITKAGRTGKAKLGIGGRASKVTGSNYRELGNAFIEANDGKCFLIALRNIRHKGDVFPQTLPQWGAWSAFFRRAGIQNGLQRLEFYTVPAEWPHQFTSDSTVDQDHEAGAAFERQWLTQVKRTT